MCGAEKKKRGIIHSEKEEEEEKNQSWYLQPGLPLNKTKENYEWTSLSCALIGRCKRTSFNAFTFSNSFFK
jgi:hypothetical protein